MRLENLAYIRYSVLYHANFIYIWFLELFNNVYISCKCHIIMVLYRTIQYCIYHASIIIWFMNCCILHHTSIAIYSLCFEVLCMPHKRKQTHGFNELLLSPFYAVTFLIAHNWPREVAYMYIVHKKKINERKPQKI